MSTLHSCPCQRTCIRHGAQQAEARAVVLATVHEPVIVPQVAQVEGQVEAHIQRMYCTVSCHHELYDLTFVAACLQSADTQQYRKGPL